MTIDEQPGALIVTAPFLPRRRAVALAVGTAVVFAVLGTFAFGGPGPRGALDVGGMIVVFGGCGYFALILTLDRTVTTVRRDRIVVRYGPVAAWPGTTINALWVEDVRAQVRTGITRYGGRIALDEVTASLVGGRSITLVDNAGDTADAEHVAAAIMEWLWAHR